MFRREETIQLAGCPYRTLYRNSAGELFNEEQSAGDIQERANSLVVISNAIQSGSRTTHHYFIMPLTNYPRPPEVESQRRGGKWRASKAKSGGRHRSARKDGMSIGANIYNRFKFRVSACKYSSPRRRSMQLYRRGRRAAWKPAEEDGRTSGRQWTLSKIVWPFAPDIDHGRNPE